MRAEDAATATIRKVATRRQMLAGLTGVMLAASSRRTGAQPVSPPSFATARHQFTFVAPARTVPPMRLAALDGRTVDFAALRGKVVLVNLWATWCPACRAELPQLDRLQMEMADDGVQVVAVAVDRGGRAVVEPFVRALKLRHLAVVLDPGGMVGYADADNRNRAPFALYGMPISYVVDAGGRIVGYMPGDADWTSPAGRDLLRFYRRS